MFDKIQNKIRYFLLSAIAAIAIMIYQPHPVHTQTVANAPNESDSLVQPADLEKFSDAIAKLEAKWEGDYENYFSRDFTHSSRRSAQKIAERLTEIKAQTSINPAVIWAVPQDDFLQLMLVTPDNQFVAHKVYGAKRDRLTQRIAELEVGISDRHSLNYLPPARIIYDWLFKPLDPYLTAEQIDTVLLCTGPSLRSLSFAALHDGEKFVVEKYNIARIPAFSLTDTSYNPASRKQVLATGASVFEDLPALPGVEVELNTIVPKIWSGQKMLNNDFTVPNLLKAHKQGDFEIIHIASHSKFKPGTPENSYIQFGDRKLTLDRINQLELDLPKVDLLVLSACETALGNEDAEFGFAGFAMQAGVKSALASLWTISDAGTVVLMSEFYQQLKSEPIKSAALRNAQLSMLQQKVFVEGTKVRGSQVAVNLPANTSSAEIQNFDHPFYWAGFTIIGNPW